MANETIRARIEVLLKGMDQVESLKNAVRQLQTTAAPASADLQKLKNAAMQLGGAADRTENDLRRSINALKDVRAQLSLTGREYQQLTGTINKYQAQLDRATGAQQRGGRAAQFAQTAGAVAASGVFGGPEGLIGAGVGAFFGPAGALAGGAIGAQVSQLRQAIGDTATYASEISKLNIALRSIAGSQQDYLLAQTAINRAVEDFNVPIKDATQAFTRLSASVIGAGGNVTDAEKVYRGVSSAIKATGGSAEDVQAAITAMSQVFGKGKVSAEELQGQLGERLPGAVTKFAQATGRTLPQLAKDLEQGTVGLNDLMKFVELLSRDYDASAKRIADSQDESGARMKVSLDRLRQAIGETFKPVGSALQDSIAKLADGVVRELGKTVEFFGVVRSAIDPFVVDLGKMKAALEDIANIFPKFLQDIVKSIPGFIAGLVPGISQMRTILSFRDQILGIKRPGAQDTGLYGRYAAPEDQAPTPRPATVFASPTGDSAKDKAAEKAKSDAERLAREQQQLNESVAKAQIEQSRTVFNNQMELIRKRYDYEQERIQMQRDIWAGTFEGVRSESARAANEFLNRLEQARQRVRSATLGVVAAQQNAAFNAQMQAVTAQGLTGGGVPVSSTGIVARTGNTGQSTGAHLDLRWGDGRPITKADADKYFLINGKAPSSFGVTSPYGPRSLFGRSFHAGIDFGTPAGSAITLKGGATFSRNLGNTGAGGYAIEVMTPEGTMKALHLMAGSAMRRAGGAAGVAAQARRNVTAQGRLGSANAEVGQANAMLGLEAGQTKFLLQNEGVRYVQQRTQSLRDEAKALENNKELLLRRAKLEQEGIRPEYIDAQMKIAEIEQQRAERLAQINENIAKNQYDLDAVAGFRLEIEETNAAYDRQIAAVNALVQAQTASGVALANYIGQLKQQLADLTNLENVLIRVGQVVETEISTAMSSAITAVVTGSGSIKQALSDMFRSIGQSFVKMATDIIAKQLVIVALNSIAKIFGSAGGFGFSGAGPVSGASVFGGGQAGFNPAAFTGGFSFANGGVMTSNGPIPLRKYARGGIANSPQLALYGEGSRPEAYVPLPDGRRIPVNLQANDNGQNGKLRSLMGGSPAAAAPTPVLNMSFQTTNIGGTEYVSRDQLEAAMAATRRQAARDGAKRGMSMTLDKLQQSPGTRGRVGLR